MSDRLRRAILPALLLGVGFFAFVSFYAQPRLFYSAPKEPAINPALNDNFYYVIDDTVVNFAGEEDKSWEFYDFTLFGETRKMTNTSDKIYIKGTLCNDNDVKLAKVTTIWLYLFDNNGQFIGAARENRDRPMDMEKNSRKEKGFTLYLEDGVDLSKYDLTKEFQADFICDFNLEKNVSRSSRYTRYTETILVPYKKTLSTPFVPAIRESAASAPDFVARPTTVTITKMEKPATFDINTTEIKLAHRRIEDLSEFRVFTKLEYLDLTSNNFNDLSPLSELTNLKSLEVGWNSAISDLNALGKLTDLESLSVFMCSIRDLNALSGLANLKSLTAHENEIREIKPLCGLTTLETLGLNNNLISDISALRELTNLRRLSLNSNQITDISPLSELANLKILELSGNPILDFSPLSKLAALEQLQLNNTITDVSVLEELINLKYLDLTNNKISDISTLGKLTNVDSLYLNKNSISDISALGRLTMLKRLELNDNSITDINTLSGLTMLESLKLNGNPINGITALRELKKLKELYLQGIPSLSREQQAELRIALPNCKIYF